MTELPSICFVALRAYPVLAGSTDLDFIGGAEVQQVLLARALAKRGHRVTLISHDFGQPPVSIIDGVTVRAICAPGAGLAPIKVFHPFCTSLWRAVRASESQVVYQRAASRLTGILSALTRQTGAKFVYAAAHDTDFIPGRELIVGKHNAFLYRHGLRHADAVVVQTPAQAAMLREAYAISGTLIASAHPEPEVHDRAKDIDALWVGTFRSWKRPELFIELAKASPSRRFAMIGGAATDEPEVYERALNQAKAVDNLQLLGFKPYSQAEEYFDRAKIFVNTSTQEGFPNTFLQAWSRGIPVVSFCDVSMLGQVGAPLVLVSAVDETTSAIENLLDNPMALKSVGQAARAYFDRFHRLEVVVSRYVELLQTLCCDANRSSLADASAKKDNAGVKRA